MTTTTRGGPRVGDNPWTRRTLAHVAAVLTAIHDDAYEGSELYAAIEHEARRLGWDGGEPEPVNEILIEVEPGQNDVDVDLRTVRGVPFDA